MGASLSLHGKFIAVLVISASAVALLFALAGYQLAYRHAMEDGRSTLRSVADAVDKTVAVAAYADDRILMQELVSGIGKHSLVRSVTVFDKQGRSLLPASGAQPASAAPGAPAEDAVDRPLVSPFDAHESVGRLHILVDSAALQVEARRQATAMGLSMVALTAVMALVLSVLTLRTFSRPLHALAEQLRSMEPGTGRRIGLSATHEHDELGTVALAANRLLQANEEALTREREARQEIALMESRYRQIFDFTSAGIFVISLGGKLLSSNPTVARLLGTTPQELAVTLGEDFIERVFLNATRARSVIDQAARSANTSSGDLAVRCADGTIRWVHCLFSVHLGDESKSDQFVEGVMYDVTQRKREEQAVKRTAHIDALTGLKNRAGIDAALEEAVATARQLGGRVGVFYIDLDGFKAVNDHWGHAAGDAVLVECARRLTRLIRHRWDFAGRLGGDELLVAVRDLDGDDALWAELAQRIVKALSMPIAIEDGQQALIGASVGVAVLPLHAHSAEGLISAADGAMYQAKRAGKGRHMVAGPIETS